MDRLLEHAKPVFEVDVPEGRAELCECITTPDIVHQNVQAFVPLFDLSGEFFHLDRFCVINANRNAVSSCSSHHFRGLFNGFWTARRRRVAFGASAAAINSCTLFAERGGNAAAGSACCAGNKSDAPLQTWRSI